MRGNDSKDPLEWIKHAEHHLAQAKLNLKELGFGHLIAFDVHQIAEKSLKGVLIYLRIDYPLTHDLVELRTLCEKQDSSFSLLTNSTQTLTNLYREEHYPYEYDEYSEEELNKFISAAEKILNFCKSKIGV